MTMRRISGVLLVIIISISVVGCGNASAISESSNANTDISSTASSETLSGSPPSVINTTGTDNVSEETATEVTEVASEPQSDYTGSLYTLPVGAKGEEWTEAQLDEYLKDCKAYQKLCQPNENGKIKVDIDELMKEFGFEYVDTYNGYNVYNIYWKQRGRLRMVAAFTSDSQLFIYMDNGVSQLRLVILGVSFDSVYDDTVTFHSKTLKDDILLNDAALSHLKGISAILDYLSNSDKIDCGKLPYPAKYSMDILTSGSFNLNKSIDFVSTDITFETHNVYQ